MHRQAKFPGDGNQDAAARRAVELGHDEASDAGAFSKNFDLLEGILSGRGVKGKQRCMRR
ncbi:hypothetical protein D3C87_2211080 [compost metagenome]